MSGGNLNPFKPGSIYEQIGQGVGHAVENIGKNPLPVVMAIALTVASGGLGIGAAVAEFAALEGAAAAAVSAGVNAAIGNAAATAINGGNVSQIATSGIIAGLSAGAAAGFSSSETLQAMTKGMDQAAVKTITMAAGQSIGGAVTAVLQGKDPLTGALSGAVQGALTSALTNGQIADFNSTAAKVIGNVTGAAATAAMAGGNVSNAIANSAVYGTLRSGLSSAYDAFNTAKAEYQKSYDAAQEKMPDLVKQAQDLLPTVEKQQSDAQASYDKLQQYISDYNTAKANNDADGMTAAANAFNALKPTYEQQLSEFNTNNGKLTDLSNQITNTNSTLTAQQQTLQDNATQLKASYETFTSNLVKLEQDQAKIDQQVSQLPTQYKSIYNDAVSKGEDGSTAFKAAIDPYNKNVEVAKATIADLPTTMQDTFKANLAKGMDPSVAAQNTQDSYTQNVLAGLSSGFGMTGGSGGDKGITLGGSTSGLNIPTNQAINVDQNILDSTGANLHPYDTTSTGAAKGASPGGFGLNPSLPAQGSSDFGTMSAALAPNTVMGTGLPGGGEIGVTYELGANGLPATDAAGNPIKATSVGLFGTSVASGNGAGINVPARISTGTGGTSNAGSILAPLSAGAATLFGGASSTPSATTSGTRTGITDLKPNLVKGGEFSFANEPNFETNPLTQLNTQQAALNLPDYTQQILAAATGGYIQHMASGEMPQSPSPTLRPTISRGNPFQAIQHHLGIQLPGFQQRRFDTGGAVMDVDDGEGGTIEHRPEFFSPGGLASLENTYVKGDGDGTSDSVPAMLADGEFVIPADVVSKLGNGSSDAGAKVLSGFLETIREHSQNHNPKDLPPSSKGALAYLLDAKRKVS